ncbi:hypothetical protein C1632_02405 [Microbacterium testaceum]|uniref:pyocin knob domain-containing protein n=1 Tax=Microbacterium testaceum TaxID=2033 RepID=UPI000CCF7508|nr:pyocin knob domain-containing protein [Microbacterium testaceum]PNW10631.1 hypothetical protein C1632_02405 [Microbacterium testaceum]
MTVINVTAALTALGGSEPITSGRITVEYLRGKNGEPATRAVGAAVTLPTPIVIAIADGSPVEPVDVPPTDGTCYARIWVECRVPRDAGFLELPAVAIPASGTVDITALVAVDPASYEPVTTVVTAWQVAVDQVAAMQTDVTARSAQAVEAATDAGTFAGATEFDANRAGQSAFAAGQSAASALGHKNAAAASADAAAGSATSAAASVISASTERQGAADERLGARQERLDAQTARTGAETAQTGAQTARTGSETARTGAETAKTAAEAARDASLAGQFAGASLGTADLDTVTTPGVYRQNNQGNSTLARNYPAAGTLGVLTVIQASTDSWMQQEYDPSGYAGQGRVVYRRVRAGGNWQPWRAFTAQRIDKTAGLAVYGWDDAAGREQLLYGDTGFRGVSDLAVNGWSISICTIRRVGSVVTFGVFGAQPSGATADTVLTIPGGFRPSSLYGGNTQHLVLSGSGQIVSVQFNTSGAMIAPRDKSAIGQGAIALMTWMTADTWPTTLPGTALGAVPNV